MVKNPDVIEKKNFIFVVQHPQIYQNQLVLSLSFFCCTLLFETETMIVIIWQCIPCRASLQRTRNFVPAPFAAALMPLYVFVLYEPLKYPFLGEAMLYVEMN